ncbi:uncharacterized protein LOC111624626 [Centruroides sculpturatus]|uniref:uncharacterized protein LOC111624626 n=1 Tax=Centruroides sculpturatus TaxID=218467 RepID=UPI000C6E3BEC|nr:uncharacterized protein LOC111624626 [Centruroides sculpturatus]
MKKKKKKFHQVLNMMLKEETILTRVNLHQTMKTKMMKMKMNLKKKKFKIGIVKVKRNLIGQMMMLKEKKQRLKRKVKNEIPCFYNEAVVPKENEKSLLGAWKNNN